MDLQQTEQELFVGQSKEGSSGNAHIWMSWQKVHDVEFCVSLEQVVKFTLPALAQLKAQGKVRWVTPTRFYLTLKHAVGSCIICDYISPDTLAWLDITWALFNVSSRRHLQAASTRFVITIVRVVLIIIIFIPSSPDQFTKTNNQTATSSHIPRCWATAEPPSSTAPFWATVFNSSSNKI